MKKKKLSLFAKILLSAVGISAVAVIIGAFILSDVLEKYESARPVHLAEEFFDTYFAKKDYEEAVKLSGMKTGEFEGPAAVASRIKEIIGEKELIFYEYDSGADDSGRVNYAIAAVESIEKDEENGESVRSTRICNVTFVPTGEVNSRGFSLYELGNVEMLVKPKYSVTVTVPETSALFVNGKKVNADFEISREDSVYNSALPEGAAGLVWVEYKVDGLFAPAAFTASDKDGVAHSFDENNKALLNYDEKLKNEVGARVLEGMEYYAMHMQADVNFSAILPYFERDTAFYKSVYDNPGGFVISHTGYRFENEVIDEFYRYDENTFSCHVSFKHVLTASHQPAWEDQLNMRVICRMIDGQWMINNRVVE